MEAREVSVGETWNALSTSLRHITDLCLSPGASIDAEAHVTLEACPDGTRFTKIGGAVIEKGARIGGQAQVDDAVFVGHGARVGFRATLEKHVTLEHDSRTGIGTTVREAARFVTGSTVGNFSIIGKGAVIGSVESGKPSHLGPQSFIDDGVELKEDAGPYTVIRREDAPQPPLYPSLSSRLISLNNSASSRSY